MTRYIFKMYNVQHKYELCCKECGSKTTRYAKREFNCLANEEDIKAYKNLVKLQAEQLSKEPYTCNKCLKSRIKNKDFNIVDASEYDVALLSYFSNRNELKRIEKNLLKKYEEKYKGKVAIYFDEEVFVRDVYISDYNNEILLGYYKINKKKPWQVTSKWYGEPKPFKDFIVTEEVFDDRLKQVERNKDEI